MNAQAGSADRLIGSIEREVRRGWFCTLATASPTGAPQVVGILYQAIGPYLYVATGLRSRKARNVRQNSNVAVCIPVRKIPFGPPLCVQFQGRAEILSPDDAEIVALLRDGKLKRIAGLGVLKEPDLCFLRVTPGKRIATYGVGVGLLELVRDPTHASRSALRDGWRFDRHA